jgi:hypothetical protein
MGYSKKGEGVPLAIEDGLKPLQAGGFKKLFCGRTRCYGKFIWHILRSKVLSFAFPPKMF